MVGLSVAFATERDFLISRSFSVTTGVLTIVLQFLAPGYTACDLASVSEVLPTMKSEPFTDIGLEKKRSISIVTRSVLPSKTIS